MNKGLKIIGIGLALATNYILPSYAQEVGPILGEIIPKYEHQEILEKMQKRQDLIKKIIKVESSENPSAHKRSTGARGLMQITPIVLKEWNQFHPQEKYSKNDLFNSEINKKIGQWYFFERIGEHYLPAYGLKSSLENQLAAYNLGIGNLKNIGDANENWERLPNETRDYIENITENQTQ